MASCLKSGMFPGVINSTIHHQLLCCEKRLINVGCIFSNHNAIATLRYRLNHNLKKMSTLSCRIIMLLYEIFKKSYLNFI